MPAVAVHMSASDRLALLSELLPATSGELLAEHSDLWSHSGALLRDLQAIDARSAWGWWFPFISFFPPALVN